MNGLIFMGHLTEPWSYWPPLFKDAVLPIKTSIMTQNLEMLAVGTNITAAKEIYSGSVAHFIIW